MTPPLADSAASPRSFAGQLGEKPWFNALWFQSTWFCTVLGRDNLLVVSLGLIGLHLLLVARRRLEIRQLALLGGIGIAVDTGLSLVGVFQFAGGVLMPGWLGCLWLAFATTPGRSLAFLGARPWLTALAGGLVFPFNYFAGSRLGAVEFGWPLWQSLLIMALIWSLLLPALYYLQRRLFGPVEVESHDPLPG
ncbi:DUF2878 domain-containing protein [Haliea sp. E1-2-M8]|uniref:DUF2878 domain-containing protein n=1 Tax=Haliea sp. E1-2-M8 TaxID=3064706 RepID=UPI002721B2EC|nr:DUF2878 domain-containing protein [Haliea sp. E1-2-M8]MDO8860334.1 DUF2878 domain-containing protein [Haliea sp. E1-2-M8]